MDSKLELVKKYADEAHGDQTRKYTPDRYIVHPVRVMKICQEYDASLPVLAAALLHDVLEDTPVQPNEMREFLTSIMEVDEANRTLKLVRELTDVYIKKDYPRLNRDQRKQKELDRIKKISPQAQTIKYADIMDNCQEIVAHDSSFAPKFLKECYAILKAANRGNSELHHLALDTVQREKKKIGLN